MIYNYTSCVRCRTILDLFSLSFKALNFSLCIYDVLYKHTYLLAYNTIEMIPSSHNNGYLCTEWVPTSATGGS